MSQLHLVGVLVRLFALYIGLTTVQLAPSMVASANAWSVELWVVGLSLGALLVPLLAAALLWFFNLSVARALFYEKSGEQNVEISGGDKLETVLFGLFGLWCVCTALADGAYWLAFFQLLSSPVFQDTVITPEQKGSMASSAVTFALGLVLLLRARGVVGLLSKLRERG